MEQETTNHKAEKVRSYKITFKLAVVDFAALKYKLDRQSIRDWKKKRTSYKNFPTYLVTEKKTFAR